MYFGEGGLSPFLIFLEKSLSISCEFMDNRYSAMDKPWTAYGQQG